MLKMATRDAYGKALAEFGEQYKDVVVLDADLSKSTKTADFAKVFPERFFNIGIAEQNLIGTAAGFAAAGKIPFASTFAVFATGRAYEQIRNSVGYPHLNVKIAASHAGITVGEDGGSHQSIEDIGLMRGIPGMTVMVPADGVETRAMVQAAIKYEGPVYLRLGRPNVPVLYEDSYKFEIGKASVLREGKDVAIIACGIMVAEAMEAAKELADKGIDCMVINMGSIKPIDEAAILKAAATGAIVTAEEHSVINGLGSAVAEVLVRNKPVPVEMVGVQDRFGESGKPDELVQAFGLTAGDLVEAVNRVMGRK